jgi:pentatricopeptide repeat protein
MPQKMLRTMQQQYLAGDNSSRPNTITYNTVLIAFVGAGHAERAEELLEEMRFAYFDGNNSAKPDVISFHTVVNALLKSNFKTRHNVRKPCSSAWHNYIALERWTE